MRLVTSLVLSYRQRGTKNDEEELVQAFHIVLVFELNVRHLCVCLGFLSRLCAWVSWIVRHLIMYTCGRL